MKIRELPIDKQVVELLSKEGLDELYPPQQHAIEAGVLEGKNLVLASPTASGKTLVAELCILQHVLEHRGKAIYLAPLRALASEKFNEFQRYSAIKKPSGDHVRAGISTGDYDSSDPWLGRYDIIISTNEKCLDHSEEVVAVQGEEVKILRIADLFAGVAKQGSIVLGVNVENAVPKTALYTLSLNTDSWEVEASEIHCVSRISQNTDSVHTLKFESGRTLAVTSGHNLFVLRDGSIEKVKASDAIGRTGVCLRDLSRVFQSQLQSIDLVEAFEKSGHIGLFKGVFTERNFSKLALALRRRGLSVQRANERAKYYTRRGVAPIAILTEAGMKETVIAILSTRAPRDRNIVQRSLRLTRELGKFVGYLVSEGSFTLSPRSAYTRVATVSDEILEDLKLCAKSLGLEYRIYQGTNRSPSEFRISSKVVFHLFKDILCLGTRASSKQLPTFFMHANEEFQKGLLSSLFDGDGGISMTGIEYCTKNRLLALQLALLLSKYDVHAKIMPYRPRRYPQNVYWRIAVMGAKNVGRLAEIISPVRLAIGQGLLRLSMSAHGREDQAGNIPARDLPLVKPVSSRDYDRLTLARSQGTRISRHAVLRLSKNSANVRLEKVASAPLAYLRVRENSTAPPPPFVYNLQTSHGNFFTASGILVSNCDSLLRHRAPWMNELTLVVADEVHLLTEQERGPTLEVVLTRLTEINPNIQILALSATVRNAEEVGSWLKAGSVTTDWRPVPLKEGIYHDNQVQFRDGASRAILSGTKTPSLDIALDVLSTGGQALIFTETRRSAVEMGRKASVAVKSRLSKPEERALNTIADRILSTGEKTRLSETLAMQVAGGAGFHHAGLAGIHRGIIEDAFREGRIKVLAATPTLCLPAGEEIFGNPAPVAIEKLSSGDRVLTHGNVFEEVVAPTSRWHDGPLVKITPWFQLPMRMTPEHNVLKVIRTRHSLRTRSKTRHWWTYSKPEWTPAKNLNMGDLVLFPRLKEEHELQYVDLPDQGPLANQFGVVGKHWSRLKIHRLELTPQTLEILGLYLADGYTGRKGQVMFALNTEETELTSMVTDWFKAIGLRPSVNDSERHRRVVRACSKQLAESLRTLCGHGAAEKRVPHQLMYLPNSQLAHFIRGMWRGDGDIARSGARTARYSTVSRTLAKQLFAVLVKLGYMPTIKLSKRAGITSQQSLAITHQHNLYTVSVSGKQLARFLVDVLKVKPDRFTGNREFNRGYLDSNYYYMPIRKIEKEPYHGTVHNLEVRGHSSYVGSFVVHNSAGVNLPARAVVISSYERYEAGYGRYPISVLEYKQFCGRAGRPKYDKFGEALLIARNPDEAEWLMENYVLAQPEKLWSKLAAERVLRPHVLSTVAAGYAHSEEGLYNFFARTFYAHQYGPRLIKTKIGDILRFLFKEEMVLIEGKDLSASKFGKRVSELYIDPMSAVILRDGLYNRAKKMTDLSILHLIAKTPDLSPRPRPRGGEVDKLSLLAEQRSDEFTYPMPTQFEDPVAYEEFLGELKAAQVLSDWIDERTEDQILETRKVEPGDLLRLVQGSEWLILATQELGRLFGHKDLLAPLEMLKVRLAKGVRPELVKLTTLEGVGRVRARMLYDAGLRTIEDIKERSLEQLMSIRTIGPSLAKKIKEQAGGLIKADEWEKAKNAKPSEVQQQAVLTEYEDSE